MRLLEATVATQVAELEPYRPDADLSAEQSFAETALADAKSARLTLTAQPAMRARWEPYWQEPQLALKRTATALSAAVPLAAGLPPGWMHSAVPSAALVAEP
jgi:hypothetical protein